MIHPIGCPLGVLGRPCQLLHLALLLHAVHLLPLQRLIYLHALPLLLLHRLLLLLPLLLLSLLQLVRLLLGLFSRCSQHLWFCCCCSCACFSCCRQRLQLHSLLRRRRLCRRPCCCCSRCRLCRPCILRSRRGRIICKGGRGRQAPTHLCRISCQLGGCTSWRHSWRWQP